MDLKDDIKSRLNIEEVIGRYVQLKKAGRNFKGLSPFTNEKTPSFVVSSEKQIWHDFSSNKGGDMFSFVMEAEGLDFKEALELLARQAGLNLNDYKQFSSGNKTDYKLKDRLLAANKSAQIFFQKNLSNYPESVDYIKKRGISRQSVIDYGVGWAGGPVGNELSRHLKLKGFSETEMIKAGLAAQKYSGLSDVFRNRLVISLSDIEGRVVGFTGRTLINDNPKIPKYLNTSQTLIYDKGRQVFGLSLAKQFIKQKDAAILVEGNLDVITLFQAGFQNVVATAGTAMTLNHLKQIKRFSSNIYLAYDSDAAGVKASERAIMLAEEAEMSIYIIDIDPQFKDPDEVVRKDPELFKKMIAQKSYGLDWLINKYAQGLDLGAAADKSKFISNFSQIIIKLNDPILKDHYINKIAEMTGLAKDAIKLKVQQSPNQSQPQIKSFKFKKDGANINKTKVDELNSTIDELLALSLRFNLKLSLVDFTNDLQPDVVGDNRFKLISGSDVLTGMQTLLNRDDSYAKIISLRSEEQFVNWDQNQVDDHQKYLQKKLKILIIKNKIDLISGKITGGDYKDQAQLQHLLETQLSLTNKLRGEENG